MANERDIVRDLARKVAAIAAEPRMKAIRKRWCDVNALRRPDRAPVWCRPVACWAEIIPETSLKCRDPWLCNLEYGFRQIIFKRELDDDTPVDAFFDVSPALSVDPTNTWGVDIAHHAAPDAAGSWSYDPALKERSDFDRLRTPRFTVDRTATDRAMDQANALLGDILPVRLAASVPLGATMGTAAADLLGLEQMMVDMIA